MTTQTRRARRTSPRLTDKPGDDSAGREAQGDVAVCTVGVRIEVLSCGGLGLLAAPEPIVRLHQSTERLGGERARGALAQIDIEPARRLLESPALFESREAELV